MKELGFLTWQIALFFQNYFSGSDRNISGHYFCTSGDQYFHIQGPVLSHPGTSTFTSGDKYFHIWDQYLKKILVPDVKVLVLDVKVLVPDVTVLVLDVKVLVPGCESTGPRMWKYWSPDVLVLVPGFAKIIVRDAPDRPRRGFMKKIKQSARSGALTLSSEKISFFRVNSL